MRSLKRRPSSVLVVAALGVLAGLAGVAVAAIPDSSGVIHGCYARVTGNLRVVDSAQKCRKSERAIQWNQKGPSGPVGPPGPAGPPGGANESVGPLFLADGQRATLAQRGPFTFTASCDLDRPPPDEPDRAEVVVSTARDHA